MALRKLNHYCHDLGSIMEMQAFINGLENTMKNCCLSVGEGLGLTLDLDQRDH